MGRCHIYTFHEPIKPPLRLQTSKVDATWQYFVGIYVLQLLHFKLWDIVFELYKGRQSSSEVICSVEVSIIVISVHS